MIRDRDIIDRTSNMNIFIICTHARMHARSHARMHGCTHANMRVIRMTFRRCVKGNIILVMINKHIVNITFM